MSKCEQENKSPVPGRPVRVMFLEITLKVGGAERTLGTLLQSLDRSRVQPSLVCLKDPGEVVRELDIADITVYHNLMRSKLDPGLISTLAKVVRQERPDIIYTCNYPLAMWCARMAAALGGVKIHVVALHSMGYVRRPKWRALNLKVMSRLARKMVAVSEGQKQYHVRTHGIPESKIEVIYVGIDTNRFSPEKYDRSSRDELGIPPDATVVGILAALRPEKKHSLFLQTAQSLLSVRKDLCFLLVGDGPERAHLETMARDLGIMEHVRFAGSRSDVPQVLRAFDISVLCSGGLVETFPQSLIESMAMELPVVSTKVGSIDEIVVDGDTGILVPEGDVASLANAIEQLTTNAAKAREMGSAGRQRVEQLFSRETMVRRFEDMFEGLVYDKAGLL